MEGISNHRKSFRQFEERIKEELGESLEHLYLFGSVSRDEEEEESDVDVLVVVDSDEERETVEGIAFDASVDHGVFIVPIIKTVEEYEEKKDSLFINEVREKGEAYF